MTTRPLISIGIPTWNRARYVAQSIRSALEQTYSDIEIVVSDNHSTDETPDVVHGFDDPRIKYARQRDNVGAILNLDACLRRATGELFLLLSDDDLLEQDAIKSLSGPLLDGRGKVPPAQIGLAWSPCLTIDEEGHPLWRTRAGPRYETSPSFIASLFSGARGPRLASVMVRTEDGRRAGGYDEPRYRAFADTANWAKVALSYPHVACIGRPMVKYRMHTGSATSMSLCSDWRAWGSDMLDDLLAQVREHQGAAAERQLARTRGQLMANVTAEILMRGKGRPGWVGDLLRECWRSREIMLTPYVAARAFREGWKLARFGRPLEAVSERQL